MADPNGDGYRMLREAVGAHWIERDALSVRGPDAIKFLQGQCSQDIAALAVGATTWTWVLQPRGKVDALCRATRVADDEIVLDTDGGWGDAVETRLNRFKLRTKAEITLLPWTCLALRGPGVNELDLEAFPGDAAAGEPPPWRALDAGWPGLPGVDLLGPCPAVPAGVALVDDAAFELARVEAGVARMGAELTEDTIPAETDLVPRTVSFTKGCYTGQELVARIDSRGGHVPRHLRLVRTEGLAPVGATVTRPGGAKAAGTLTSVAPLPAGGAVALGYLGRDVEPGVAVEVTWPEGSTTGRAEALPGRA